MSIAGTSGMTGIVLAGGIQGSGTGGSSPLGHGGRSIVAAGVGAAGTGYGAGAGGSAIGPSTAATAGQAGQPAIITVQEFN